MLGSLIPLGVCCQASELCCIYSNWPASLLQHLKGSFISKLTTWVIEEHRLSSNKVLKVFEVGLSFPGAEKLKLWPHW